MKPVACEATLLISKNSDSAQTDLFRPSYNGAGFLLRCSGPRIARETCCSSGHRILAHPFYPRDARAHSPFVRQSLHTPTATYSSNLRATRFRALTSFRETCSTSPTTLPISSPQTTHVKTPSLFTPFARPRLPRLSPLPSLDESSLDASRSSFHIVNSGYRCVAGHQHQKNIVITRQPKVGRTYDRHLFPGHLFLPSRGSLDVCARAASKRGHGVAHRSPRCRWRLGTGKGQRLGGFGGAKGER